MAIRRFKKITHPLVACVPLLFVGFSAQAADYPSRPIRLIVQFSPGGNVDTAARVIAKRLSEQMGQQVIVDNRAGAQGSIAYQVLATAPADGYTLGIGHIGHLTLNPHTLGKVPYDPLKDFAPISRTVDAPNLLVVHPGVKAASVQELVVLAKANPGKLAYGTGGVGTVGHLAGELLSKRAGVTLLHVPFKGTGLVVPDLLSGQLQMTFSGPPALLPHVKSGRLRALAITTLKRSPAFPEFPTVAESGFPGFEAVAWMGIIGPARLPGPMVGKLNREVRAAMDDAGVRSTLGALGFEIVTSTPEAFATYIRSEHALWGKIVKERGIRGE